MTGYRAARERVLDDAIADLDEVLEGDAAFSPRALARALRAVLWVLRDEVRDPPATATALSASPPESAPASDGLLRRPRVQVPLLAPDAGAATPTGLAGVPATAAPPEGGSRPTVASEADARRALARFEPTDINRWLATGTLFQMRADLAYLNLTASERLAFDFREKLRDLGFAEELGVLEGHALRGEVLLFRRRG